MDQAEILPDLLARRTMLVPRADLEIHLFEDLNASEKSVSLKKEDHEMNGVALIFCLACIWDAILRVLTSPRLVK